PARRALRSGHLLFVLLGHLLGCVISVFRSQEELLLVKLAPRQQVLALHPASRESGLRLGDRRTERSSALLLNSSDDVCRELRVAVKDQKPVWPIVSPNFVQLPRSILERSGCASWFWR